MSQIDPMWSEVAKTTLGAAHEDAEPNARRAARRYSRSLSNEYHRRGTGSPEMRDAQVFMWRSAWPVRHAASLMSSAQWALLDGKTEAEVIQLYHDTLKREKSAEAEDTASDLCPTTAWIQDAVDADRDLALDATKAACCRWFAEHRTPRERVRAGK